MQLLIDTYERLYGRVGHNTWDITATPTHLWFQQVTVAEALLRDATDIQHSPLHGFTCEGIVEKILTTNRVKAFNDMFHDAICILGLTSKGWDTWYPDQLRISDRWMPAISMGSSTFELFQMYGDTIKIANIKREKAQHLPLPVVLMGTSGRVLMPTDILANIPDAELTTKRVSMKWEPFLKHGLELEAWIQSLRGGAQ
jgi:hypothetical protein